MDVLATAGRRLIHRARCAGALQPHAGGQLDALATAADPGCRGAAAPLRAARGVDHARARARPFPSVVLPVVTKFSKPSVVTAQLRDHYGRSDLHAFQTSNELEGTERYRVPVERVVKCVSSSPFLTEPPCTDEPGSCRVAGATG
jgi:hypothetical protein